MSSHRLGPTAVAVMMIWSLSSQVFSQSACTSGGCGNAAQNTCTGNNGTVCCRPGGPDLICGNIQSAANFSAESIDGVWFDAFSFGHTQCNVGSQNLLNQQAPNPNHPVWLHGLFKLKRANPNAPWRLEQIGVSWVRHSFTALQENTCGCNGGSGLCAGSGGAVVGIGCCDPHSAAAEGSQISLTPRWQVNAFQGTFSSTPANPPFRGTTARRVRIRADELEPSASNVIYFVETAYICAEDAAAGHADNNGSYRQVTITGGPNEFSAAISAAAITQRERYVIHAWRANDPDVVETLVHAPNEGLFILAAKATDLGNGVWNYEYAVENVNSDVAGRAFGVPLPAGAVVSNVGFHDVHYHSGDGIDSATTDDTDWAVAVVDGRLTWSTEDFKTNPNANALRFATLYNFRFDCNAPPVNGVATLNTFKVPGSFSASTVVPGVVACAADVAPAGQLDGQINVNDLLLVINHWGACASPCQPDCQADINHDCAVNVNDLLTIINGWGPCP